MTDSFRQHHTVLDFQDYCKDVGVRFRQSRDGKEEDLVCDFLDKFKVKIHSAYNVTFFKEPCLESGVPDLVGVIWKKSIAEKWNETRLSLTPFDIRIMHYLSATGTTEIEILKKYFGNKAIGSIEKLECSEMVRKRGDRISPRPISKLYATKHIFAIEAKIMDWKKALNQAFLNKWFATTSYVLLPSIPSSRNLRSEAEKWNIGLWDSNQTFLDGNSLSHSEYPESYASWLFNEWAWRASIKPSHYYAKY